MSKITKQNNIGFLLPNSPGINANAVEKVNKFLPELLEKTRAFDRKNSQTSLALMSLTMLTGQTPYRMLRQILAETEKRKEALAEAQVTHAELEKSISMLEDSTDTVEQAQYRRKCVSIAMLETKINGCLKDIATLIDAYNSIKEKNNITDWDEREFEAEEKQFHVRRGFELMYRNLLDSGRASVSTIEYLQQFGIHPQISQQEVAGYINYTTERIRNGEILHGNDLEEFLDQMTKKYYKNVDKTCERIFGKSDITNIDYMYKVVNN